MSVRINIDDILRVASESMFGTEDGGFCTACGEEAMNVEPDACEYECEFCGENAVYGAEELLLRNVP